VLLATVLALSSAGLHATWNLLIKTSDERDLAAWGQFLAGGILFAPVLVVTGFPERDALPWLCLSAFVHVGYVYALVAAYHHGDFSLAYPIARGGGALAAAVAGGLLLGDDLPAGAWAALVVVAFALSTLVPRGAPAVEFAYALATAGLIATYTVVDTVGARRTANGFAYGVALTLATGVTLSVAGIARGRGPAFARTIAAGWRRYALSGLCLTGAYGIVLVAVRLAPVGYVATLRESSVVIGALIGWLLLGEALGGRRTLSSVVVAAGLVALVVFTTA